MAILPGFSIGRAPAPFTTTLYEVASEEFTITGIGDYDVVAIDPTHFLVTYSTSLGNFTRGYKLNPDYSITEYYFRSWGSSQIDNIKLDLIDENHLAQINTSTSLGDGVTILYDIDSNHEIHVRDAEQYSSTGTTNKGILAVTNQLVVSLNERSGGGLQLRSFIKGSTDWPQLAILTFDSSPSTTIPSANCMTKIDDTHFAIMTSLGVQIFEIAAAYPHTMTLIDTISPANFDYTDAAIELDQNTGNHLVISQPNDTGATPNQHKMTMIPFDGSYNLSAPVVEDVYDRKHFTSELLTLDTGLMFTAGDFGSDRDGWASSWTVSDNPVGISTSAGLLFEDSPAGEGTEDCVKVRADVIDTESAIVAYQTEDGFSSSDILKLKVLSTSPILTSLVGTSGPFSYATNIADVPFQVHKVDGTHFIRTVVGDSTFGHARAQIYAVDGSYAITEVHIADINFYSYIRPSKEYASAYLSTENLFTVAAGHKDSGGLEDGILVNIYPVNTTAYTIDISSPTTDTVTLGTSSTSSSSVRAIALDANRVAVVFQVQSEGYVKVYNIDSGGNITNSSAVLNYASGVDYIASVTQIDANHFAIVDNVGIRTFNTNPASTHAVTLLDTLSPAGHYSERTAAASILLDPNTQNHLIVSQKSSSSTDSQLYMYPFDVSYNLSSAVYSNTNFKSVYRVSDMFDVGTSKFAMSGDFETANRDAWMSIWNLEGNPVSASIQSEETLYDVSTEAVSDRWVGHVYGLMIDSTHAIFCYRVLHDWYFKVYEV